MAVLKRISLTVFYKFMFFIIKHKPMPTIKTEYLGDLRTQATHVQSSTQILTDAPFDNKGKGEAFSPSDLVAGALGSCMMTIMGIAAQADGIDLKGSEMEITKGMSADAPRRIARIGVQLNMVSKVPLSQPQQDRLERAAYTCPVALSLHPDIEQAVEFSWRVAQEA